MLKLDNYITINEEVITSPNLCSRFTPRDLDAIGLHVFEGYSQDKVSRKAWETRTQSAMDLALQIQQEKTFPWPNCSNIKFPLITIATLQFHARAYPALLAGPNFVKARSVGPDPEGIKSERAKRVGDFMSYQVSEEDESWEEQHDRLLINLAVVGCAFMKTYYSPSLRHNVSELVLAKDLVVNYWAKSIETCNRKTHIIPMYRNEIHERVLRELFVDCLADGWYLGTASPIVNVVDLKADQRQGITTPQVDEFTPFTLLEQHCLLDLDNDGYYEPYIVTIEESSKKVLRIVARYENEQAIERVLEGQRKGQIISIEATEYFTKYPFIPSPDGGIYDIGFGILCGPLNESVNSLVNQLVDAGTMSNGGGGFLGRGAKIRGGVYTFAPFEWKRVDSTGEDLHKSIVPLTVKEPSNVLLSLLSLLIDYTNRISGATDVRSGENPGQNTPASTTRTMVEEGGKIYSAIFKRCWRSMREEFKKLYRLNSFYLPLKSQFGEQGGVILREDFTKDYRSISPSADPNITSDEHRVAQVIALKQAAMSTPGYDPSEVEHRYLEALRIEGIPKVYPGPKVTGPLPNAKVQVEQMKVEVAKLHLENEKQQFIATLMEDHEMNKATIILLHAQAAKAMEEAGGVKTGHQIAAFEAMIGAMKQRDDALANRIKLMMEGQKNESQQGNSGGMAKPSGDSGNVPTGPDAAGADS